MDTQKKWVVPLMIWVVFETVAVTLWLTKDNLFYLFNFSYIGSAIAIGFLLLQFHYQHARRIVQLFVGLYMLVYLGLICNENMQIEISDEDAEKIDSIVNELAPAASGDYAIEDIE